MFQLTTDSILIEKIADDQARLNTSQTNHSDMIKYIGKVNMKLIEKLVADTVRTIGYKIEEDLSNQEGYIDRKMEQINMTLYRVSHRQLTNIRNPKIVYSNYRKLFNRTLARLYKEQV